MSSLVLVQVDTCVAQMFIDYINMKKKIQVRYTVEKKGRMTTFGIVYLLFACLPCPVGPSVHRSVALSCRCRTRGIGGANGSEGGGGLSESKNDNAGGILIKKVF